MRDFALAFFATLQILKKIDFQLLLTTVGIISVAPQQGAQTFPPQLGYRTFSNKI